MKKIYTFLLLISGINLLGTAQTRYTAAVLTDPVSGYSSGITPVKNWRTTYSVSFQMDAVKPFFCLIDQTALLSTTAIPTPAPTCPVRHAIVPVNPPYNGLIVKDIHVVDDYAFFCGSISDTHLHVSYAIWGYFYIMDFFGSNMNIEFNALLNDTEVTPTSLDQIVAYPSRSSYTVVTYGRDTISGKWKIVEIPNALGSPSSCNVFSLPHQTLPSMGAVYIDDMTLTENYVIFSGHDNYYAGNQYVWFGCYKKGAFLSGNNLRLPLSGETNGHVICTALNPGEDLFALDYTYYDEPRRQWYNRLRVIDPLSMLNLHSQQFKNDTKREPLRMKYLPDLFSVELIQENYPFSHFIAMQPFSPTPYSTSRLTPPGELYYNIDNIMGYHFIAACGSTFYFQDRTMNTPASTASCPQNDTIIIDLIDNIDPVLRMPFPSGFLLNRRVLETASILTDVLKVDCFSFER